MFLGDLHGKFDSLIKQIKSDNITDTHIVQVGDFGVGFKTFIKDKRHLSMYHHILLKNNIHLWAIRGNHDYKPYFDKDPFGFSNIHLVSDYTVLNLCGKNILCIGGAISIDRIPNGYFYAHEIPKKPTGNENWWPDEVFNIDRERLKNFRDINIVVTHTAPDYCVPNNVNGFSFVVNNMVDTYGDTELKTDLMVERYLLTETFNILKENNNIECAYYGHFHESYSDYKDGTYYRLLNINQLYKHKL